MREYSCLIRKSFSTEMPAAAATMTARTNCLLPLALHFPLSQPFCSVHVVTYVSYIQKYEIYIREQSGHFVIRGNENRLQARDLEEAREREGQRELAMDTAEFFIQWNFFTTKFTLLLCLCHESQMDKFQSCGFTARNISSRIKIENRKICKIFHLEHIFSAVNRGCHLTCSYKYLITWLIKNEKRGKSVKILANRKTARKRNLQIPYCCNENERDVKELQTRMIWGNSVELLSKPLSNVFIKKASRDLRNCSNSKHSS